MKKVLNWIAAHKVLVFLPVLLLVILLVWLLRPRSAAAGYREETVTARDIQTYNSFVGKVEVASDRTVLSSVSETVTEVPVRLGDRVEQGQTIALLDTEALQYNISLKEASLSAAQTTNRYNIQDAQRTYENYKAAVDSGLNTSLQSAQNQVDSTYTALQNAQSSYDSTRAAIDAGTYDGTAALYSARKAAGDTLNEKKAARDSAAAALEAANAEVAARQAALEAAPAESESTTSEEGGDPAAVAAAPSREELQQALDAAKAAQAACQTASSQAQAEYTAAETAYREACAKFDYKRNELLNNLQQQIDSAQASHDAACANYDAVALQVSQQLGSYAASLEKTQATASTRASQLELTNLRNSLADYTITAPCSGTVTALNVQPGDAVTPQTVLAVISDLDSMEIAIRVDEYSILNTAVGSLVTVYVDSVDSSYDGVLSWVADTATVENGVSYFEATVRFVPDEKVRSGMSVETRLVNVDAPGALSVSVEAVEYREDNTAYVLVRGDDGEPAERTVLPGASDGVYVQITQGLSEGETVLTAEAAS